MGRLTLLALAAVPSRAAAVSSPASSAAAAQWVPFNEQQSLGFIEAENFTAAGGWEAREWAKTPNYFASTVANVFHSRRAYMHGPSAAVDPELDGATASLVVPHAGEFTVLVRYEAPYRFEVPFTLSITQVRPPPLSHRRVPWTTLTAACVLG